MRLRQRNLQAAYLSFLLSDHLLIHSGLRGELARWLRRHQDLSVASDHHLPELPARRHLEGREAEPAAQRGQRASHVRLQRSHALHHDQQDRGRER